MNLKIITWECDKDIIGEASQPLPIAENGEAFCYTLCTVKLVPAGDYFVSQGV